MRKGAVMIIVACLSTVLFYNVIASSYSNLTVSEAWTMIHQTPALVILDVRTQSEYDSGHIGNATHIPVTQLPGRLDELETTDRILVYCASGGRSATASQTLVDNGFLFVFNMLGGLAAWLTAGYPVYVKYSSIQEVINNRDEGDTIYVSSGAYSENLVVNKSISLIGENRNSTLLNALGEAPAIHVTADNVSISGFTIQHGGDGVNAGVKLEFVDNCIVSTNIIRNPTESGIGLMLQSSSNNYVYNNVLINNTFSNGSITLFNAHQNIITDNYVTGYLVGVFCSDSDGNELVKNTVTAGASSSADTALRVTNSDSTIIIGNTFADNMVNGLELIQGAANTTVVHNNFVNNMNQINVTGSANTTWDNGCEGNYWSNYAGLDLDNDGVGDTDLPMESVDSYPLINKFWSSGDVDHDLDVDIFDIVKAAGIYGSTSEYSNWNPHCDVAEPYGIIDIFDMVTIAIDYGEEYTPH